MVHALIEAAPVKMTNEERHKYSPPPPPPQLFTSRFSDEELLQMDPPELVRRLRKIESDNMKLMMEHGSMMKEVNCRMQVHLLEIRGLKEVNQRLQDDNQELRDLCCFLDDDRQKGRKLAREWQRFGRYTASVMRQEVSTYQAKLRELERKQQELIKDNLELKELCLYLDEERHISRASLCNQCSAMLQHGPRDEGDGSSSSTNNDEPTLIIPPPPPSRSSSRERLLEESIQRQRNIINEQILQYIRSLEQRILQLEEEKQSLSQNGTRRIQEPSKPEAVVHAMKVLEVHEQLEKSAIDEELEEIGQREKALVREMCNVVWRKLEDGPAHT